MAFDDRRHYARCTSENKKEQEIWRLSWKFKIMIWIFLEILILTRRYWHFTSLSTPNLRPNLKCTSQVDSQNLQPCLIITKLVLRYGRVGSHPHFSMFFIYKMIYIKLRGWQSLAPKRQFAWVNKKTRTDNYRT